MQAGGRVDGLPETATNLRLARSNRGLELKTDTAHNLRAWIDTARGVLYLYWND